MLTFCWPAPPPDLLPMLAMLPNEKRSSKLAELDVVVEAGEVGLVDGEAKEEVPDMGGREEALEEGERGEV